MTITTLTDVEVMPPLIRKKSGDIVKSSLKLLKLMQHSMSSPNLKSVRSVRFADRLTNIRMFDGQASPAAVSNQTSPLHSPKDDELRFRRPRDYFEWHSMDDDDEESSDEDLPWYSSSNRSFELDYSDISRPHQYFYQNKIAKPVHIHSLQLITLNNQSYLSGLINVDNLGFEKLLMIKLTLNQWKNNLSFSNNSSIIQFNKSIDSKVDQFKFKINLQDLLTNYPDSYILKQSNLNMEICCKYQVNNQTFWDNNFGRNYKVVIKSFTATNNYKVSNTIKNYNYELVNEKLIKHQEELDKVPKVMVSVKPPAPAAATRTFNDLLDNFRPKLVKSFSTSNIDQRPRYSNSYKMKLKSVAAPSAATPFTSSLANNFTAPVKVSPPTPKATAVASGAAAADSIDLSTTQFNSTSYSDLLANFCFGGSIPKSNSNTSLTSLSKLSDNSNSSVHSSSSSSSLLSNHCSIPSTASTLHSFSDSIHI